MMLLLRPTQDVCLGVASCSLRLLCWYFKPNKKGYSMPEDLVVDCFDIANGDIDKFISMLTMHGVTKGNAVDWYHLLRAALEK